MMSDYENTVAIVRHKTVITTETVLSPFMPTISLLYIHVRTYDYVKVLKRIHLLWSDILTSVYTYIGVLLRITHKSIYTYTCTLATRMTLGY